MFLRAEPGIVSNYEKITLPPASKSGKVTFGVAVSRAEFGTEYSGLRQGRRCYTR